MADEINEKAKLLALAERARDCGSLEEAEQFCRRAAAADPTDAEPWHHLGGLHLRRGALDAAERAYRQALALAPDAGSTKRVLATLLLSQGRYPEGFQLFEARHLLPNMAKPELPFAEWRGEDLAGKRLLIWPEQGFGDQIQFARFVPVLKARGAEVTLLCRPALARLFEGALGVSVMAAAGAVELPDPDYWVMTCSLAGRLGATPGTLPGEPYLRAVSTWPALPDGFKVGLATSGNPAYANDANRSLPAPEAERLRGLPGNVMSLDPTVTGARDFADTAALMEQLDLVIAVDTAAAHLAGAMGKPCWVLLPAIGADWRWMRGRSDSPWYPSMRLYRQAVPGDWSGVLRQVEADLRDLL